MRVGAGGCGEGRDKMGWVRGGEGEIEIGWLG